jgi:N-acetylmuramoyl-L-alanine amidase
MLDIVWTPSPNFGRDIRYIIIHGTGLIDDESALSRLRDPSFKVSSHYFISSLGVIHQLVKDEDVAWHAGESQWKSDKSLNYVSLGIELFNSTAGMKTPYTEEQYLSLISILSYLIDKYSIPLENILGHSEIAPMRKSDPGVFFEWSRLYNGGVAKETETLKKIRRFDFTAK